MGANSKIEWTHHTFNPWVGCTKVSAACDFCYAETWAKRSGHPELWNGSRRHTSVENWRQPLKWNAKAAKRAPGEPRPRVFCASLADVFDNQVPGRWRGELFDLIMQTPDLNWLLLTKRPQNILKMTHVRFEGHYPDNIWFGTTIENREEMQRRARHLKEVPARIHFWSVEPLLEDLGTIPRDVMPEWIICGGESGSHARMMDPDWARNLHGQCLGADIPFFMKQMTKKAPIPDDLMIREFP